MIQQWLDENKMSERASTMWNFIDGKWFYMQILCFRNFACIMWLWLLLLLNIFIYFGSIKEIKIVVENCTCHVIFMNHWRHAGWWEFLISRCALIWHGNGFNSQKFLFKKIRYLSTYHFSFVQLVTLIFPCHLTSFHSYEAKKNL